MKLDGVPVRIYSAAKTIADCLKYRKKLGGNLAAKVLRESIARRKCREQSLRHFAKICRVGSLVQAPYILANSSEITAPNGVEVASESCSVGNRPHG